MCLSTAGRDPLKLYSLVYTPVNTCPPFHTLQVNIAPFRNRAACSPCRFHDNMSILTFPGQYMFPHFAKQLSRVVAGGGGGGGGGVSASPPPTTQFCSVSTRETLETRSAVALTSCPLVPPRAARWCVSRACAGSSAGQTGCPE